MCAIVLEISRNEGAVTLCDDSIVYISPAKRSCVGSTRLGASF